MPPSHPTSRPTDEAQPGGGDLPAGLVNLPWIDPHNHAHTLSWADRERYALAGCRAMVMVASGVHWTPYRPVRAEDVRYLWDAAVDRRTAIARDHFFDARLAVGVQTGARVEDPDALLDAMDDYCGLEAVVAVGETGVTPAQDETAWSVDEQRRVVGAQMGIADRHGLPVILHTPNPSVGPDRSYRPGLGVPGYEQRPSPDAESVIHAEEPALAAVEIDVEAARDAGVAEERVVASHADPTIAPYLMDETGCYLSYTIGHSWLTGVSAATVADAVAEYGPERIMIDTDCANVIRSDVLSTKRAVFELYRLGIDEDAIRQVVYENPRAVFGLEA